MRISKFTITINISSNYLVICLRESECQTECLRARHLHELSRNTTNVPINDQCSYDQCCSKKANVKQLRNISWKYTIL